MTTWSGTLTPANIALRHAGTDDVLTLTHTSGGRGEPLRYDCKIARAVVNVERTEARVRTGLDTMPNHGMCEMILAVARDGAGYALTETGYAVARPYALPGEAVMSA